ncbi:autotransporter domain-containing protein [Phyllobacterium myrsinacearum]|uniref:Autotransporter domain-containing protein n=1 Tax=Phyllobacterium myrsinacearum TaxID=28101 RepID=A0A2S9JXQ5_9HYPH|nr:autotransporter domain-containing protein [Phyllobacterium myrsinacearum]PRD58120.1 hypothetical protein C5750_02995 [Phyllobacterium myrsinacearum]
MSFHAAVATVFARLTRRFRFRNHLLHSGCAALLLAGSGAIARADSRIVGMNDVLRINAIETAETVTVNAGGQLEIEAEGKVSDVILNGGYTGAAGEINNGDGYAVIRAKGAAESVTINIGGKLDVEAGGQAGDVTVNSGDVSVWGKIGTSTIYMGGKLAVLTGGIADNVIVHQGGLLESKGKINTVTIGSGGLLRVLAGGVVDDITVHGAGGAYITGRIGKSSVDDKGVLKIKAKGMAGSITVNPGGRLNVETSGGAGDVTLTGGASDTNASHAVVNGTAGDITLGGNSTLSGTGHIRNLRVLAGGTVSPGNSAGTLHADGNVHFDQRSTFNVELSPDLSHSDQLAVTGSATLLGGVVEVRMEGAGTLLSQEQSENLFDKHFIILTAEKGVTGRFDAVFPHYNYITPSLAYTDKTVSVTFKLTAPARPETAEKPAVALTPEPVEADGLKVDLQEAEIAPAEAKTQPREEQIKNIVLVDAVTPNQKSTGHAVLQLGLGNRLLDTVLLSKKGDVLNYDALSGEAHASLRGALLQDAGLVSAAASGRIRAVSTTALWGQGYGGWSHGASDGNAAAYDRNTGGFVTGVDSLIAGTWRLGVLAGYGSTSLHGAASSTSADSYQLGVYGGTSINALSLSLGTILAHHAIDTHRKVAFGTLDETESAGYSANTVQLFGEAAYRIDTPYAAFEPFAAAAYTHLKTDGFSETGGIAALSAPAATTDLTTTTLGLRASRAFTLGNATTVTARGMAGWRHAYGDVAPQAQFAFASGGESFAVSGQPMAQDTALIEAGLAFDVGKATTIGLTYTGAFSARASDNAVKADLTIRF